jgi:hypothetical protein
MYSITLHGACGASFEACVYLGVRMKYRIAAILLRTHIVVDQ